MSALIPFESAGLPAHLRAVDPATLNTDLTAHAGGGFPVLSIRGKVWAVVRDGERMVLPNPKDPDSPATSIEVVLVKANKDKSKVWYAESYDPNTSEKAKKPDCYSTDGRVPAADADKKQATSCATCKHNQWGSKINDKGVATKGKACQDSVRIAVVPNGQLNDPHLLRIPPASITTLGEYGQMLAKRGVSYNAVVTKVSFDAEAESPKLVFKAMGFLGEAEYAEVQETLGSHVVEQIVGAAGLVGPDAPAAEEQEKAEPTTVMTPPKVKPAKAAPSEDEKPAKRESETMAQKAEKTEAKGKVPRPVAVVDEDPDLDIDGIDFDD